MGDPKFTKGPWHFNAYDNIIYSSDEKRLIDIEAKPRSLHVSVEERDANAHLIAAAPELYEALNNLYSSMDSCVDLTPEVLMQASAALAKARDENGV